MIDLKGFIEEKKINKSDICSILGVSRATLYNWLDEKKTEQTDKIVDAIVKLSNSYIAGLTGGGAQTATAIGDGNIQNSKVHIPQNKADIIRQLEQLDGEKEEVKLLRRENAEQKEEIKRLNAELLKCKDQIISILSKDRGQ